MAQTHVNKNKFAWSPGVCKTSLNLLPCERHINILGVLRCGLISIFTAKNSSDKDTVL